MRRFNELEKLNALLEQKLNLTQQEATEVKQRSSQKDT